MLYPEISKKIEEFIAQTKQIDEARQKKLVSLSAAIYENWSKDKQAEIIVICTHNSRRSLLLQLLLKTTAVYFGLKNLRTFSGGVEVTQFHPNMLKAIEKAGFSVKQEDETTNPKYVIPLSDRDQGMDLFYSKIYNDSVNPQKNFIALLVCEEAAEACPIVFGASHKILLTYKDPKFADGSLDADAAYATTLQKAGIEMVYVVQELLKMKVNSKN